MYILLVDDDRDVLNTTRVFLETRSHHLRCALNGLEAYNLIESDCPDLVITDIHMPKMSGIALLSAIRSQYPDLPVVLITAYDRPNLQTVANCFQASACFKKPVPLKALLDCIDQYAVKK